MIKLSKPTQYIFNPGYSNELIIILIVNGERQRNNECLLRRVGKRLPFLITGLLHIHYVIHDIQTFPIYKESRYKLQIIMIYLYFSNRNTRIIEFIG